MNNKNLNQLISEALAIEARDAREAGALGYMARSLIQATLPHSRTEGNEFERRNGAFTLTILANSKIGLPYGSIPRLLIAWLTTEAVRTKQREIVLGSNLSEFMSKLDLIPTGGRWGTITRLREQMTKLFSATVSCTYDNGNHWAIKNVQPVSQADLWWNPKSPKQITLFESTLTLGEEFFKEIINYPIPIDMDALRALKKSPLALDIYCWLTYRMSYLKKSTTILWEALQVQFGSDYSSNPQGLRDFRRAFLRELRKVHIIYPEAILSDSQVGLVISPSKPHISMLHKPVD
jgi:hypothetical protein